jgi:hypothetical protein
VKNVTPDPAQPRAASTAATAPAPALGARRNQLYILAIAVIVVVLLVKACAGRENQYEKTAHELTQAVQHNDYNAVAKLENSQTAATMGRGRLGTAADAFAQLGGIKKVHENTPAGDGERVHEFDVTFDKGTVHEKILFDPDGKVFRFHYDPPVPKK